jgi:conjugal transfer pilus assembly protein TraF
MRYRSRQLAHALAGELKMGLQAVIAGACVSFILWTLTHLLLGALDAPLVGTLEELTPAVVAFGAAGAGGLLLIFAARGLAAGLAESFGQAERRTRAATLIGFAAAAVGAVAALALALPARAEGGASDYCARDLGAWFYCSRPAAKEEAQTDGSVADKPAEIQELEAFQKEIEEARAVAIWRPTEDNVRRFYLLQKTALDRGGLFADQWRRLVWTNPDLDYTQKRPVSEIGKRAWQDERLYDRELFLKAASSQLGLFYVFRESCGACRIFSPILKAFGARYSVPIKAISADGGSNADFPEAVADKGQLKAWGFAAPATPALMIFQKASAAPARVTLSNGKQVTLRPCRKPKGCLTYLGAGVLSVEDIAERLFVLLATEPGQDF